MPTPEQLAREIIDTQLCAAGWVIQDRADMSLGAGLGVAVREYPLATGPSDYLLFVDRKACGVVEAKPEGVTLSGVADQASRYQHQLPAHLSAWGDPLRFDYEASASEILFSDRADPSQRSRYLFGFHRPETLHEWLKSGSSLRARLTALPPLVTEGLRDCQVEAITALEASLAEGKPRALVQMTMGAGKTFTAATQARCSGGKRRCRLRFAQTGEVTISRIAIVKALTLEAGLCRISDPLQNCVTTTVTLSRPPASTAASASAAAGFAVLARRPATISASPSMSVSPSVQTSKTSPATGSTDTK